MNKSTKCSGRRRSHSLVGFASKDLCETIPKSLSSSERLSMLIERSFQYALTAVQKDLISDDGFDISNFRNDGMKCWEQIKSVIEEQNLYKIAVTDDTIANQSLLAVKAVENEKAILEAEQDKWNEKLAYYREELKKEMNPCEIPANWKGKEILFDYSKIIEDASATHKKLQKQIKLLESPRDDVKMSITHHNEFNLKLLTECESYFEPKRRISPNTVIKKISVASKTIKRHRYS